MSCENKMKISFILILCALWFELSLCWPNEYYGGIEKVRGVNIGAWLLLEKWMTPSLFADVPSTIQDEFELLKHLGPTAGEELLRRHWDTWFTESDLIRLKEDGINHLRIPIGYWAFSIREGEPWVNGSWDFALRACGWARKHNLKVMIDLHGAPGSQNGEHHSGQSGPSNWFYSEDNMNRTIEVVGEMARVANLPEWRDTITIIQVLNEPILWGEDYDFRLTKLKDYYLRAYDKVRQVNNITVVAFHDAFIDWTNWYYFRDDPHYWWVMLDTHLYYTFNPFWFHLTCDELVQLPCNYKESLREVSGKLWTVVGEWSLVLPKPCTQQGYFGRQQIAVNEISTGWFYWNFKVESGNNTRGSEWSFYDSISNGWINLQRENKANCPKQLQRKSNRMHYAVKQMNTTHIFQTI